MATTTGLLGPFRLAYDEITNSLPRVAPGVFAVGHRGPDGKFYVDYIGRADRDLREKLLSLIGSGNLFKFRQTPSNEAAFHAECDLFTNSSRRETECIPTGRPALIGSVRAAGFSAFKGHHGHDVVESSLIAVVPIGALRRVGIEVTLVDIRVGCLIVEPIANVVAALTDKRNALSKGHVLTTLTRLFLSVAARSPATPTFLQQPN